jgi:hypothetical protein
MSYFVSNLGTLGCLYMEYRRKYMGHHDDPGRSSMYSHNDTTRMFDCKDWAWKEVAYREGEACNETSGMSGAW